MKIEVSKMIKRTTFSFFLAIASLSICLDVQGEVTNRFQEGVSPTGGYVMGAVYIRSTQAGTNQNGDPDQELIIGTTSGTDKLRGLFEFDISAIPAGATINSVSLVLRQEHDSPGSGASITLDLHEYAYDVDEATATWNAPGSGDATAGGTFGALLASATFTPIVQDVDLTFASSAAFQTAVDNALAGDGSLRLITARNPEDASSTFARFDDELVAIAADRPELVVAYTVPASGPQLTAIDVTPVSASPSATTDYSAGFSYDQSEATTITFDFSAFGTGAGSMDLSASSTTLGDYSFGGFTANPTGVTVDNVNKTIAFTGGTLASGAHTVDNAVAGTGWRFTNASSGGAQDVSVETASATNTFSLLLAGAVAADTGGGATEIGIGSATLRGELIAGTSASAFIAWGATDGGTGSTNAWDNVAGMGVVSQGSVFSNAVAGLYYGVEYNYRVFVTNATAGAWSGLATFTTLPPVGAPLLRVTSGLVAHYDAAVGVTSDGTGVLTWEDQSGNGYNATRASGTPTQVSDALNALPEIQCRNRNSYFNVNYNIFVKEQYVVGRAATATWNNYGAYFANKSGRGGSYLFQSGNTGFHSNQYPLEISRDGVVKSISTSGTLLPMQDYMVLKVVVNTGNTTPRQYYVGRSDHSVADLDVLEIIGYGTALSDSDEDEIGGYLAYKYGIATAYPAYEPPAVISMANSGVSDVTVTTADLLGTLDATQAVFTVTAYWSTNNNAGSAAWQADGSASNAVIGTYTDVMAQSVTGSVSSLTGGTTYYYTMRASNAATDLWASPNGFFGTLGAPGVDVADGATNITSAGATLQGELTSGGVANGYIVWGDNIPGSPTSTSAWDTIESVGSVEQGVTFSAGISGLDPVTTYYYSCYVTNSLGDAWSSVTNFVTDVQPLITTLNPINNASDVAPDGSFVATFNKDIAEISGGVITLTNLTDGSITAITLPDAQATVSGTTLTIDPTSPLDVAATYAVLIDGNAVEDLAGANFVGITDSTTWRFTATTDKNWSLVAYWPLTNGVNGQVVTTAPALVDDPAHPTTSGTEGGAAVSLWHYDSTRPRGAGIVFETYDDTRLNVGTMGINAGEDVTWATWMRTVSGDQGVFMGTRSGTYYRFRSTTVDGSYAGFNFSPDANDNVWHHMVLRRSAGTWNVFIDGVQASGSAVKDTANNSPMELGGSSRYNEDFLGYMSDAAIWKEALSQTRLSALAAGGPVQLDGTAPTIVTLSPTNNATGVGTVDDLIVTFSETVQMNGGFNIVITNLTDGTGIVIPTGDPQISVTTTVLTINPTAPLVLAKTYAVMIDDGAVSDDSFNSVAITDTTTWRFETVAGDAVAPTVASLSPLNGAIQVPLDENMVVTFDEPVVANTGNIMITNLTDGVGAVISVLDAQITVSGLTLTINPSSDLLFGKTYAVLVDAGAVNDSSGNPFAGILVDTTWRFGSDTAPAITSLSPLNNATAVMPDTDMVAIFDEDIFINTGNVVITNLTDGTALVIAVGDSQISVSGATLTINPTSPLEDRKIYAVMIDAGGVEDGNATPFAGINDTTTWRFSTTNDANWSLVAYWPLDDGPIGAISSGTTLQDLINDPVGDEVDGVMQNNGSSFVYDATRDRTVWRTIEDNRLQAGNTQMNRDFTWSVWAKTEANDNGTMMGTRSGNYTRFYQTSMSGGYLNMTFANAFNDDVWHHFVLRRQGNTFDVYVDSTNQATKVQAAGDNNMKLELGGSDQYNEDLNGYMSEVAIWEEALPLDRIQQLYEGGLVIADTTPPVITVLDPTNNATGIAVGANLVVTFDDDIVLGSGDIVITNLTNGSTVTITVPDVDPDGVISVAGSVVTINGSVNLNPNETYAVLIEADALENEYGYGFAGIANSTTWRFTTTAPDTIPPTIDTLSPTNNATDVTISQNLVTTFDENVVLVNGGVITVTNLTDGSALVMTVPDAQLSTSSADLTINPSADLDFADTYAVLIGATAVEDTSGNAFAGILNDTTWRFSMDSAPVITSVSPLDDTTGVGTRTDLVMTFNRDVTVIAAGVITISNVTQGTTYNITLSDSQVIVSGATVTIDASPNLVPGNQYAVLITGSAIEDLFGQNFAGISDGATWNFTADVNYNANIVAYYPMSDGPLGAISAGTVIDDRIDDPTYAETDGLVQGTSGSYVYDSTVQRVVWQTGDDDRLDAGDTQMNEDFTWVCWAKSSGGDSGPLMGTRDGNYLRFNLSQIDGSYMGSINYTDVNDNAWHHMAFVRDGTQVRVYIDGVLDATSTETAGDNNMRFELGGSSRYSEDFNGCMYDVAVWKEVLTVARIQALATGDKPWIPPTSLFLFR